MKLKFFLVWRQVVFVTVMSLLLSGCAFKGVVRSKDIVYRKADPKTNKSEQRLNVFAPRHRDKAKNVFIYLHGGNWNSGKKSLYNFFGNRLARKGVVAVILDYPLAPGAQYNEMAQDAALSVQWVQQHIEQYGGDPSRIFISGHSAGGHLAALVAVRHEYFDTLGLSNPLKGVILIDAFGLDISEYLHEMHLKPGHTYFKTFTTHPAVWKEASPIDHLHANMPPMLIFQGGKTYPAVKKGNERFIRAMKAYTPKPEFHVIKGKHHIPMITQFFKTWNPAYKEILRFMDEN